MSRYRDDRDNDRNARRDYEDEARGRRARGGYYGERGAEPFDAAYDGRERGYGGGRARDYQDEDVRGYRDRDYARTDYETGAVGRRGERYDYERGERRYDDERRDMDRERDEREDRASRAEGRGSFARDRRSRTSRSHLRCRDIMTRDVTVATRETTLAEVARMMRDEDTGVIPVVERPASLTDLNETRPDLNRVAPNVVGGDKLVGLITDRDIAVRAVAEGKDVREVRAGEVMTAEVHTAQPNDRVIDAVRKMGDKQVRRIPVVDREGILRGIISMADVALETDDDRELAEALEEISSGQSFWSRVFG